MHNLAACDGEVYHLQGFYQQQQADSLWLALRERLPWQTETITLYGKPVLVPRLMCWFGDDDAVYRYSGVDHIPLPWSPELLNIKQDLEQACQSEFNSVLANLYRNGTDSMGCHADNEKELGRNPVIASLSLGATRLFKLKHHQSDAKLDLHLQHGDLLIMAGALQHHWRHSVPKTAKPVGERINLTFRKIQYK